MGRNEGQTLPHLLDIEGVAEHLGVSVRHVRRLVYERRIPYLKWGHLRRFDPTAVAAWLEEARIVPEATGRACHPPVLDSFPSRR